MKRFLAVFMVTALLICVGSAFAEATVRPELSKDLSSDEAIMHGTMLLKSDVRSKDVKSISYLNYSPDIVDATTAKKKLSGDYFTGITSTTIKSFVENARKSFSNVISFDAFISLDIKATTSNEAYSWKRMALSFLKGSNDKSANGNRSLTKLNSYDISGSSSADKLVKLVNLNIQSASKHSGDAALKTLSTSASVTILSGDSLDTLSTTIISKEAESSLAKWIAQVSEDVSGDKKNITSTSRDISKQAVIAVLPQIKVTSPSICVFSLPIFSKDLYGKKIYYHAVLSKDYSTDRASLSDDVQGILLNSLGQSTDTMPSFDQWQGSEVIIPGYIKAAVYLPKTGTYISLITASGDVGVRTSGSFDRYFSEDKTESVPIYQTEHYSTSFDIAEVASIDKNGYKANIGKVIISGDGGVTKISSTDVQKRASEDREYVVLVLPQMSGGSVDEKANYVLRVSLDIPKQTNDFLIRMDPFKIYMESKDFKENKSNGKPLTLYKTLSFDKISSKDITEAASEDNDQLSGYILLELEKGNKYYSPVITAEYISKDAVDLTAEPKTLELKFPDKTSGSVKVTSVMGGKSTPLSYDAKISGDKIVSIEPLEETKTSKDVFIFTAKEKGSTIIVITAYSGDISKDQTTITITVESSDEAPTTQYTLTANPMTVPITLGGTGTTTLTLTPAAEGVTYTPSVSWASVSNDVVTFTPTAAGTTVVRITAALNGATIASTDVTVTVTAPSSTQDQNETPASGDQSGTESGDQSGTESGDQTPGGNTSEDQTPGGSTSGDQTPGDQTPGGDGSTSNDQTPGGDGNTSEDQSGGGGGGTTSEDQSGGNTSGDLPGGDDQPGNIGEAQAVVPDTPRVSIQSVRETVITALRAISQAIATLIGNNTEVLSLEGNATVGVERNTLEADELEAIPEDEEPAAILPIIRVQRPAIYMFSVNLSHMTRGARIFWHPMPSPAPLNGGTFYAAEGEEDGEVTAYDGDGLTAAPVAEEEGAYVFLDDNGDTTEVVPPSQHITVAAYLEPDKTYAPVITTEKTSSSGGDDGGDGGSGDGGSGDGSGGSGDGGSGDGGSGDGGQEVGTVGSSGGGCSAGFSAMTLALISLFISRRKK